MTPTVVAAAIQCGELILSIPAPARHNHVLVAAEDSGASYSAESGPQTQGFLLSDGTFANRATAYKIARASGQPWLRREGAQYYQGPDLFSEDVW